VIYVDSNIPMYLVGSAHPLKLRVQALVTQLLSAHEVLVTSAETFQEVLHRYTALRDAVHLDAAYSALEAMVSRTEDVFKGDVDRAREYAATHAKLSSRDCLHLAIMKRVGCKKIWSYDAGYDCVSAVQRIQ
jgi:uncharacterized protein